MSHDPYKRMAEPAWDPDAEMTEEECREAQAKSEYARI